MTSITLTVTGAKALARVSGPLTAGMVGIPVTIRYDDTWNGLTKNMVCRCGQWGPDSGETRTVLNVDESATVAHEVMKGQMHLYLGVEGYRDDGTLVMPTTWADCGIIQPGANAGADPTAEPSLAVWAQLQVRINQLLQQGIPEEKIAAAVAAYLEENPVGGPDSPQNEGLTAEQITALNEMFKVCSFIKEDVSAEYAAFKTAFGIDDSDEIHTHKYTADVTSAATCTTAGVRTYTCSCGASYTESIPATGHNYVDGICTACAEADPAYNPGVTLTRITAVYSGGDVPVGTAVADLTGIVVTAYYSNGTTAVKTDYTLSGRIAEGENTITVSYGGKSTTFVVIGV